MTDETQGTGTEGAGAAAAAAVAGATSTAGNDTRNDAGAAGGGEKPWYGSLEGLTDEHKAFLGGKAAPDLQTALTSWMHADKLARDRNAMIRPEPGKEKDWDGWKDLGWPADLKDYKVKAPALPEGVDFDDRSLSQLASMLHDERVPLERGQAVINRIGEMLAQSTVAEREAEAQLREQALEKVKSEWGNEYDARVTKAGRAARALGFDKPKMDAIEASLGSNAIVLELFDKIAPFFTEDQIIAAGASGESFSGPDAVELELAKLKRDPEFARSLQDPRHKDHAENNRKWDRLNQRQAEYLDRRRA